MRAILAPSRRSKGFPVEIFDSVLAVHVRGAFLACQHAVPHMRDGGSIIITSSVAGVTGDPGVFGYITAKHAQIGLMRCLAKELAPRRIRVNTLHPGPIDNSFQQNVEDGFTAATGRDGTEYFNSIIPMGRHAKPEEIAKSALFLASDMSSFSTGTLHMVGRRNEYLGQPCAGGEVRPFDAKPVGAGLCGHQMSEYDTGNVQYNQ